MNKIKSKSKSKSKNMTPNHGSSFVSNTNKPSVINSNSNNSDQTQILKRLDISFLELQRLTNNILYNLNPEAYKSSDNNNNNNNNNNKDIIDKLETHEVLLKQLNDNQLKEQLYDEEIKNIIQSFKTLTSIPIKKSNNVFKNLIERLSEKISSNRDFLREWLLKNSIDITEP